MEASSRRDAIKWLVGSVLPEPFLFHPAIEPILLCPNSPRPKCDALFSPLLPREANGVVFRQTPRLLAAIYESPVTAAGPREPVLARWLCLAAAGESGWMNAQVSADVLQPHSAFHPVEVSLAIANEFVEVTEAQLRGNTLQRWTWTDGQWVLSESTAALVFHDEFTAREYKATQARLIVATGKIDRVGFESVVHHRQPAQIVLPPPDNRPLTW